MEEKLVKLLMDRTGLSEDQAGKAVETVLGFLKDNPDEVTKLLPGGSSGGIGKKLSGLLKR